MKIGFVDYYISEWHANNYPTWIKQVSEEKGIDAEVAYAFAERDISPVDGRSTDEWCQAFAVEKCSTLEELCEKADAIIILAPSDPDKHLGYAETVLKYRKPTYIDKTFAPDLETAEKIFAKAEEYGTPFFSTSALRYEKKLDLCEGCTEFTVSFGGRSVEEYIIHPIEMVVKKLGSGAKKIKCLKNGSVSLFSIKYGDGRTAGMIYGDPTMPARAKMLSASGKNVEVGLDSDFFPCLIKDILRFFAERKVSFDISETLEAMRIRDGALAAYANEDTWIEL